MADMKKVYNDLIIINLYDITKASGLCRFESKGFCFCSYQNLMGQIPISPYLRRPWKLSTTCIGKIAGLGLGFGKLNWRPHPLIYVVFLMIHMLDLGGSCEPANLHMKM